MRLYSDRRNWRLAVVNLITRTPTHRRVPEIASNKDSMIVKYCNELMACGVDLDLYVSDFYVAQQPEQLGINTIFLKSYFSKLPEQPFVPELFRLIAKGEYSAVLLSEAFQWSTVFSVLAKLLARKRFELIIWQEMAIHQRTLHGVPSKLFYRFVLRFFLDWAVAAYIPRSEKARDFLIRQGVSLGKILPVISHGADPKVFYPKRDSQGAYVFAPCRLVVDDKGLDVLLVAFSEVKKAFPAAKLIIQGNGPDEMMLRSMITKLDLSGDVELRTEHVDHDRMRLLYQDALVTVVASRRDNVILSSMESALCGTPVVMSDAIDNSSSFADDKGGGVFKCEDAHSLSKKICRFYGDKEFWRLSKEEVLIKARELDNRAMAHAMALALDSIVGKLPLSGDANAVCPSK